MPLQPRKKAVTKAVTKALKKVTRKVAKAESVNTRSKAKLAKSMGKAFKKGANVSDVGSAVKKGSKKK